MGFSSSQRKVRYEAPTNERTNRPYQVVYSLMQTWPISVTSQLI